MLATPAAMGSYKGSTSHVWDVREVGHAAGGRGPVTKEWWLFSGASLWADIPIPVVEYRSKGEGQI